MIPTLKTAISKLRLFQSVPDSAEYWESRYAKGGNSGAGSYNALALFKAEILNKFVAENSIQSVIEFGTGDGNQLSLAKYPQYIGLDVSKTAVELCANKFKGDKSKSFYLYRSEAFVDNAGLFQCDLSMSLDVLYHIVEDEIYEAYMSHLFQSARKFVIIYSSDAKMKTAAHEQDRFFKKWVERHAPQWKLEQHIPNRYPFDSTRPSETSKADFFIYRNSVN